MKTNSLKKNAFLNIIYTLSNIVFPMVTFSYISRVLQVSLLGKINFYTNISNYAAMIASLGTSTYGIRAIARVRNDKDELAKTTTELLIINSVASLIVVLTLLFSSCFISKFKKDWILLLLNCFLILSTPLGMNWLFSGLEKYTYITKRAIIIKTFSLVCVFAFISNQDDYLKYVLILVLSTVAGYVCNFIYAVRIIEFKRYTFNCKRHIKPTLLLFASILAINVYTHLDTIMLGFINGDKEVGLYTIAVYVKTALLTVVNAISAVLLPRISSYVSEGKTTEITNVLNKSISIVMMIALPLSAFFMLESRNVILILGGKEFLDAIPCMTIIMPILMISGFSNITGNQILIPMGKDDCFMKAVISGAFVDVILNFLLMPKYGCLGAAIATLMAEVFQMGIQFRYAKEYIIKAVNVKSVLMIVLATLISILVCIFLWKSIDLVPFYDIFVKFIIFFAVYLLMLVALRGKSFSQ